MTALINNTTLRSLIAMFILITMTLAMDDGTASQDFSKVRGTSQVSSVKHHPLKIIDLASMHAESPSAPSGASSPIRLREDRGKMSVTAYMHKSLTSKLALNKRSPLTKWTIDGATKPKSWYGKAFGTAGGFLASVVAAPFTTTAAAWGYLKNGTTRLEQEKITFYWEGDDLWCTLPQFFGAKKKVDSEFADNGHTKVARIEGHFHENKLVIRFEKSRGHQTASDRVIETNKAYFNLKETLLWIRDNQEPHEYLDRSVLQNLQRHEYDGVIYGDALHFNGDSKMCPCAKATLRNIPHATKCGNCEAAIPKDTFARYCGYCDGHWASCMECIKQSERGLKDKLRNKNVTTVRNLV